MIHSLRHGVGPCSSSVNSPHPCSNGMPPVGLNGAKHPQGAHPPQCPLLGVKRTSTGGNPMLLLTRSGL
jgi:hypothetical protein